MKEMPYQSERISQLLLERYNLGELDAGERQRVEDLLRSDAKAAAYLEILKSQDREIRSAYPLERVLPGYGGSASRFSSGGRPVSRVFSVRVFALAACAAAAIAVSLPLFHRETSGQDSPFTDRVKGGTELRVYLKSDETPLDDTAVLSAGSTVQLAYTSGGSRYGVIFSIDGRRAVTLHYPYLPGGSTELIQGKRTALEEAYTLDDAPLCEIFFFVSSGSPMDAASVLNTAEILAGDPGTARERGTRIFSGYELETVYVGKE
ncbi:MAG: hypothetical protein LBI85_01305 [Spirochaetaceae bacterium]|jgi:hypothetical protein|nr:hypothetical protein [Spirochaetaceae bacterium]